MMQTKTIAMLLLIAIATIGVAGTAIGTELAYACNPVPPNPCPHPGDSDDAGHGQSFHDSNGDAQTPHA